MKINDCSLSYCPITKCHYGEITIDGTLFTFQGQTKQELIAAIKKLLAQLSAVVPTT
jgi:hypothetical protein